MLVSHNSVSLFECLVSLWELCVCGAAWGGFEVPDTGPSCEAMVQGTVVSQVSVGSPLR